MCRAVSLPKSDHYSEILDWLEIAGEANQDVDLHLLAEHGEVPAVQVGIMDAVNRFGFALERADGEDDDEDQVDDEELDGSKSEVVVVDERNEAEARTARAGESAGSFFHPLDLVAICLMFAVVLVCAHLDLPLPDIEDVVWDELFGDGCAGLY